MKVRTVSGACFVAIVVAFFLFREYVDYRLFNVLLWFFCAAGTFEVARALRNFLRPAVFYAVIVFGAVFVPLYALWEYVLWHGYGWLLSVAFIIIYSAAVFEAQGGVDNAKNAGISLLSVIYPSLLILTMIMNNENSQGLVALLLVFVIAPLTDTFAYLVGMTYGKIKKGEVRKLCPAISPNKTVAGAIGGLIGGLIGALLVYFIFTPQINSAVPALIFIIIGIVGAVFTEAGDLFESLIKRRTGIKDMGRIMPGHGGVMDRIDGMTFASAFVWFMFLFI